MASHYSMLVYELKRLVAAEKPMTKSVNMAKTLKSARRARIEAEQFAKSQAQSAALDALKVRFAMFNEELTRMASTGEITPEQASVAESALARLGALIREAEGTAIPSGENSNMNARTRHGGEVE